MPRVVLVVATIALTIYALVDCIQTDDQEVRNLPKVLWIILILLFSIVGPVAWLLAGRPTSAPPWRKGSGGPGGPGGPRGPRGPRGPEDDPDFLRNL